MKNWVFFLSGMVTCFISCSQSHSGDSSDVNNPRLTCLILGYDSVIYYTGTSKQMRDINMGKITDTAFVNTMFKKIKIGGLLMVLKPGGGADMLGNFQEMVNLANNNDVYRRSVDSADINEDKAFGFVTPPMVKAAMRGQNQPTLKLNLPRDEPVKPDSLSGFPKASRLVILLSDSNNIYAYVGDDMRSGKKYTSQEIIAFVKERRSDKNFSVVIKPSENATYKNTVDILDVMTTADVRHYALIDITKEEDGYLHQIYQ